jgi:putative holliday junction resolvase
MTKEIKELVKGKRIGAIDYGRKRVGFAVCDEFHITITPKKFLLKDNPSFWDDLNQIVIETRCDLLLIGVPYRLDETETEIIKEIEVFINEVKELTGLIVIPFDESFSSKRAMDTMIKIGTKQKRRRQKGETDKIAAAIILRDFLEEVDY